MNKVMEILVQNRRLAILRFLADVSGYELNTSILQSVLNEIGLIASRDAVETECAWLEEQGLVTVEHIRGTNVVVVHLTARGLDVAHGKSACPGVDKPAPSRM